MKAKEYLERIHRLRVEIDTLDGQIDNMNMFLRMKEKYGMNYMNSYQAEKMDEAVAKLTDAISQFADKVITYSSEIETITAQIENMDKEQHIEVLMLRYLRTDEKDRQYSLRQIAEIMHVSEDRAKHLHLEALAEFQKKYMDD